MSAFPGSPRVIKGAIVAVEASTPVPKVILFQYNPDTLTRTLKPQSAGETASKSESMRLKGAPVETISLDIELDATDQLEHPELNVAAQQLGILPQLAALETILYPKSSLVIQNATLASSGAIEVVPPEGPFTLFIWGPKRVLPVRITEYRVTEEAHDASLNPIRAKVSLGMRVLTYDDLTLSHQGYSVFIAHQMAKEAMAILGNVNSVGSVVSGNIKGL
jgi:hypothetical protein